MTAPTILELIGRRPLAPEAFRRPLDIIRADHDRQSAVCDGIEAMAYGTGPAPAPAGVEALLAYLREDLPLHTQDEEADLFPLLRDRSPRGDDIHEVLDQLSREHALDKDLADFLLDDLETCARRGAGAPPRRFAINARAFAETQRRHLGWENRLVLPAARTRLTSGDLDSLGRNMAARRKIAFPD